MRTASVESITSRNSTDVVQHVALVYSLDGSPSNVGGGMMSERVACWTGMILLGLAAVLMFRNRETTGRASRRRRGAPPVEALAEELKQAWGEYHTP